MHLKIILPRAAITTILLAVTLCACGKRGSLYLPPLEQPQVTTPSQNQPRSAEQSVQGNPDVEKENKQ